MVQTTATGLVREIRKWDLVAIGVNVVVGAGIFGLPSRIYALSGPGSLIAYTVCAAATILIVLCFAEVGSRFTETGGPYLYARQAFGPVVGFEIGWIRWLSGALAVAANSNLFGDYLSYILPVLGLAPARRLVITTVILSLVAINIIGVRNTAIASNVLVVGKLIPLVLFVVVGLFFLDPQRLVITDRPSYAGFSGSVLLLAYAFGGFESLSIPAGEARDSTRSVPFALLTTIGIVTVLYVLIQVVCIGALPDLGNSTRPLADASTRFIGAPGGSIISAAALVSIAGNLNGQMLASSRTIYAMADQRQLPGALAVIHHRFHTPYISIVCSAAVMLGLALSGTFVQLLTFSVIARLIFYCTTCAALPVFRRAPGVPPAAFRIPAGALIATLSVGICFWLLSNSTAGQLWISAIACGAGLLVYFLHRIRP
jgi:basic amino acid/polyamine antiporter, APA family